jgi:adenylate kinase family enzyme
MDMAVKKIELIDWLIRVKDEKMIQRIEELRKDSTKDAYEDRMPKTMEELDIKLERSRQDIDAGRIHSQKEVEDFFKAKFVA